MCLLPHNDRQNKRITTLGDVPPRHPTSTKTRQALFRNSRSVKREMCKPRTHVPMPAGRLEEELEKEGRLSKGKKSPKSPV
mmetsp:Transcript_45427/g.89496  ORF Transcript_45427/g.89496 Transcript_45427/m.89496 type:complete len:81 (-) Transcript_45427:1689-1931(-)